MKPFGVTFFHKNRYFYYDTNKNSIIEINKELFSEIKLNQCDKESFGFLSQDYSSLYDKGYLHSSPIKNVELLSKERIREQCDNNVMHLILQVTQECNFLCRYCVFAGSGIIERTHSNKIMLYDTAISAINFLYKHSVDNKSVIISFYGGEPLLNFDLIKQCIEYSKQKFKIKKCDFSITTNGSLLTKEKAEFFVNNDVMIFVSLDGPMAVQDMNRRFLSNGNGTFNIVYNNLKYIKDLYPDYYHASINYIPVVSSSSNLDEIKSFFITELGATSNNIRFSKLNLSGLSLLLDENISINENNKSDDKSVLNNKKYDSFLETYNKKHSIPSTYHHSGPCIPGSKKLFVTTNGDFLPCEKVNERYDINKIGDIYSGFNYDNIYNMINIGRLLGEMCRECWCIRYCATCIADTDGENIESIIERKLKICSFQKSQIINAMKKKIDEL